MTPDTFLTQLAPELCVVVGACIALFLGLSKNTGARSLVPTFAAAVLIVSMFATWRCGTVGSDPQPPGLLLTSLTTYVRWITLSIGLLLILVNWHVPVDEERGEFFAMVLFSMAGVMLTASCNDLIVLFFALELVSVPTYVLVALSRTDARASEGSLKYFFLGAMAAAIMVYGFSFLYGVGGTTVLQSATGDSIAGRLAADGGLGTYAVIGLLLAFAGLSFKIAAVPFHSYAPDVYEGAASPVTGLLGFLPKLAGFTAMIKLLSVCGWFTDGGPAALMWMLWIVAAATMTVGNVLALLQSNVKRVLAYSSIAHSGYMLIGLLVGPLAGEGPMRDGVAAMLFYIVVYGLMNLGAFAVLASLKVRGESVETYDDLAGLSRKAPLAALAMAVCVFSLMGFPPTAGFLGKVYIFSSAFSLGAAHPFHTPLVVLAVIAVINSAIGAAYYLRIAAACYLREPTEEVEREGGAPLRLGLAICSLAMIVLFIRPNGVVREAQKAAQGLESVSQPALVKLAADAP